VTPSVTAPADTKVTPLSEIRLCRVDLGQRLGGR